MSVECTRLVWALYRNQAVDSLELMLAVRLADYANPHGKNIFPSVATMAQETMQSERTVQYRLKRLLASGWLRLVESKAHRTRSYEIDSGWIAAAEDQLKGAHLAPHGCTNSADRGAHHAPVRGAHHAPLKGSTPHQPRTPCTSKGARHAPQTPPPYIGLITSSNHQVTETADAAPGPDPAFELDGDPQPADKKSRVNGVGSNTHLPAKPKPPAKSAAIRSAYSEAYHDRYGCDPVFNAKANALMCQLVDRLGGAEAALVAAFYVHHNGQWYVKNMHQLDWLIRDAEKLRTEWITGRSMTETKARDTDRKQTNYNTFAPLIAEAEARERGEAGHGN